MRILTIDDSETTRAKIKMTFEKFGHQVYEAKSGIHAHDILRHDSSFDLIICDMNMPDMDGAQFVKSQDEDEVLKNRNHIQIGVALFPKSKDRARLEFFIIR